MKVRYNNITDILEIVFKFLFLIYLALGTNSFTIQKPIISYVMWPCFVLGCVLVVNRVFLFKRYIKTPFWWLLGALLAADAVTVFYNRETELKRNVIYLALWVFYFLLLFVRPSDRSRGYVKKELFAICALYTVWVEILAFISIGMLLEGYTHTETLSYGILQEGMIHGRLYGAYTDPNLGAISLSVASLFLIYACVKVIKKVYFWIITGILICVNLLYIATTDSRTGAVSMGVCAFIVCAKLLMEKWHKNTVIKVLSVLLATVVALGAITLPRFIKKGYNRTVNIVSSVSENKPETIVDRSSQEGFSNVRLQIWRTALENFPEIAVFGTGYGGINEYFSERLPGSVLSRMNTLDNDTMNILIANGLIGFIPYVIFAFCIFIYCIMKFVKLKKKGFTVELLLLSVTCLLAACSLFRSVIFYSSTPLTMIFWLFLGALAYFFKNPETEGERSEQTC